MKILLSCVFVFTLLLGTLDVAHCLRRFRRQGGEKCNKCINMTDCGAALTEQDCGTVKPSTLNLVGEEKKFWDAVVAVDAEVDNGPMTHCLTLQWEDKNEMRLCVKEKVGADDLFCAFAKKTLEGKKINLCATCPFAATPCNTEPSLESKQPKTDEPDDSNSTTTQAATTAKAKSGAEKILLDFSMICWVISAMLLLHLVL